MSSFKEYLEILEEFEGKLGLKVIGQEAYEVPKVIRAFERLRSLNIINGFLNKESWGRHLSSTAKAANRPSSKSVADKLQNLVDSPQGTDGLSGARDTFQETADAGGRDTFQEDLGEKVDITPWGVSTSAPSLPSIKRFEDPKISGFVDNAQWKMGKKVLKKFQDNPVGKNQLIKNIEAVITATEGDSQAKEVLKEALEALRKIDKEIVSLKDLKTDYERIVPQNYKVIKETVMNVISSEDQWSLVNFLSQGLEFK